MLCDWSRAQLAASALAVARKAIYEADRLPGSSEKDIEASDKFKAAGAEVNATDKAIQLGLTTVGAPLAMLIALSSLSFRLGFEESVIASCEFGSPHKKEFAFLSYGLDSSSLEVKTPRRSSAHQD